MAHTQHAKQYKVRYELDEDDWWVATVPKVPGCHTQGRTIEQARRRIREALALFDDHADRVDLVDDIVLPLPIAASLKQATELLRQSQEISRLAELSKRDLARALLSAVSVRDAGTILGISGERVRQLAKAKIAAPPKRPPSGDRSATK